MSAAPWHVYVLRCKDGSLYTGIARDIQKRLKQHADKKGSKCLRGRLPVRLVYRESSPGRSQALRREAAIKRLTRAEKLALIRDTP